MLTNQAILAKYLYGNTSSNSTGSSSTDILAKVSKVMESRNTMAPKLNAALASDNTKLSALGKLLNGLTTFQSTAQSLSATASATTLDSSKLKDQITGLVDGYNALNTTLTGLRKGDLKSDVALAGVRSQLSGVLSASQGGTSGLSLTSIGITAQADGTLAVDAKKLQSAIAANPSGVAKLFANDGKGIAESLTASIKSMVSSSGSIEKEKSALNKDIASLNTKRSALEKSLTAQAQALVKLYSTQGTTSQSATSSTLFDALS
jgi:flagellar hook-associated protein 2